MVGSQESTVHVQGYIANRERYLAYCYDGLCKHFTLLCFFGNRVAYSTFMQGFELLIGAVVYGGFTRAFSLTTQADESSQTEAKQ